MRLARWSLALAGIAVAILVALLFLRADVGSGPKVERPGGHAPAEPVVPGPGLRGDPGPGARLEETAPEADEPPAEEIGEQAAGVVGGVAEGLFGFVHRMAVRARGDPEKPALEEGRRPVRIEGDLLGDEAEVAGTLLHLYLLRDGSYAGGYSATADGRGRFVVPDAVPGEYEVVLAADGSVLGRVDATGEGRVAVEVAAAGADVPVRVEDAKGRVRPGATVMLRADVEEPMSAEAASGFLGTFRAVRTNADGIARFRFLRAGRYRATVDSGGPLETTKAFDVPLPPTESEVRLACPPTGTLRIRVRDALGNPVAATVWIGGADPAGTTGHAVAAEGTEVTVAAGRWRVGLREADKKAAWRGEPREIEVAEDARVEVVLSE